MVSPSEPGTTANDPLDDAVVLESLPKEVGVLLIIVGIGGVALPGPIGAPFLVLGGVVLFPSVFRKIDQGMQQRFPRRPTKRR